MSSGALAGLRVLDLTTLLSAPQVAAMLADLCARLVLRADVLIENLPTALLVRWGCDYAALARRNPRLVVVSVSCYGCDGPHADRPGAGSVAEAFAGLTHLTGE